MRTLLAAAVLLTALTGCTTAPTECERVWAEATEILPAPAGVEPAPLTALAHLVLHRSTSKTPPSTPRC